MDLPKDFCEKMKKFPEPIFKEYLESLDKPPFSGYRVNTLKADKATVTAALGGEQVPFCSDGYYLNENRSGIGRHPLHHAGAIYVQEPSAMSAVTALGVRPGDWVLDLCAAPGGKSAQIAAALKGDGLLVANEFVPGRAKILLSNIERLGIHNAVVTSAHPDDLCAGIEGFFDRILVDAPCSGEGMFRKEPQAVQNWSQKNVETCAERQLKILFSAAGALRPGGVLVYSTCTFSPEEDEGVVLKFLKQNPEFSLIPSGEEFGVAGFPEFGGREELRLCRRVFPANGGEGHFVAVFKKAGEEKASEITACADKAPKELMEFWADTFIDPIPENIKTVGDNVLLSTGFSAGKKVRILRDGLLLGSIIKGRFEPSHALFMCPVFRPKRFVDFSPEDKRMTSFLHGEQIDVPELSPGYAAVRVLGIPCGFGKVSGGVLKNKYPKGLRSL